VTQRFATIEELKAHCFCESDSGCWIWRGCLNSAGYGHVWNPRTKKMALVHRLAFVLAGGMIPDGLELDHICRVRSCCNPAHLRAVTRRENLLAPGSLSPSARAAAATHCPHGHPYSGDNLYIKPNGARGCRECHRIRDREYWASNRDECNARQRMRRAARKSGVQE
jgi:hypothetical protein